MGCYQRNKGKKCAQHDCAIAAYTKGLCKKHWQAQYMPAYRLLNKAREKRRRSANREQYKKSPKAVATRRAYAKTAVYKKAQASYRARNVEKFRNWRRGSNYKVKYGITVVEYDRMLKRQRGRCKICKRKASEFRRRLHVDHCHETGKVRGLLCAGCNLTVGHLEKDPVKAAAILSYLAKNKSDVPLNQRY